MVRVVIIGAGGRMGREIIQAISRDQTVALAGAIEVPGSPAVGADAGAQAGLAAMGISITTDWRAAAANADVAIDFSAATGVVERAQIVAAAGGGVVIGTTGIPAGDVEQIRRLTTTAGARIVLSPNMSVGVNLLFLLSAMAASALGDDFDAEIIEMHHNKKADSPSGTAVRLGELIATAKNLTYKDNVIFGREGMVGARPKKEICIHAVRGGDVVGDHTVVYAADGERFELVHKASSRATFAKGALRAAKFIAGAGPGLYDMQDVLGLRK